MTSTVWTGFPVVIPDSTDLLGAVAGTVTASKAVVVDANKDAQGFRKVGIVEIDDTSGNELIKFTTTATAVNEVTLANAATGNGPTLTASGETNVPITLAAKGTGAVILGQATSTDLRLAADQPIGDSSGNELIKFTKTASAVNEITIANNSTGLGPTLIASGETNVPVTLAGKGTGPVNLGQATTTGVVLLADQPINDSSGNEYIKFSKTASAVNEITVTNKATLASPVIGSTGGDTNIGIRLDAKGTAYVGLNDPLVFNNGAAFSDNTAGAVTYTAAQCLAGFIVRDPNGAGRTDVLPTAALLVAAIPGVAVGDTVSVKVINGADAAETITIAAGAGGAFDTLQIAATRVIVQNASREVCIRITNVTPSSEAYVAYM
jgi:hypothetical protein